MGQPKRNIDGQGQKGRVMISHPMTSFPAVKVVMAWPEEEAYDNFDLVSPGSCPLLSWIFLPIFQLTVTHLTINLKQQGKASLPSWHLWQPH